MKLPVLSGDEVIKSLRKAGFEITRQKGSHVSLHKKTPEGILLVVVPRKPRDKAGYPFEHPQAGRAQQGGVPEVTLGERAE
jgi:predicted RNA binding protein YcfA (HicA-like mRNA interferase family)